MARAKKKPARRSKTAAKSRAPAKSGRAAKKKATAKRPPPRKRLSETYDFVITVTNGRVGFDVASDEGNGYAPEKPSDRDRFRWSIADPDYEFRLVFRRIRCKGMGNGTTHWPFTGQSPGQVPNSTAWGQSFEGVAKNRGAYKYDVEVQHAVTKAPVGTLDPVIIIGRV
jgi:hypothetical protein